VLRIRYDTDPDFCAILHFIGNLDEELAEIDQLLSDEKLLKLIEANLSQPDPNTAQAGRNSTPVEVIVPMLVLNDLRSSRYSKTMFSLTSPLLPLGHFELIAVRAQTTQDRKTESDGRYRVPLRYRIFQEFGIKNSTLSASSQNLQTSLPLTGQFCRAITLSAR
jgi:hypothetical protein